MNRLAILMLRLYRATISRIKGGKRCIFTPSCSVYAIEAYQEHCFVVATALTASRVLRCSPWGKGGVDYVPVNLKSKAKWYL